MSDQLADPDPIELRYDAGEAELAATMEWTQRQPPLLTHGRQLLHVVGLILAIGSVAAATIAALMNGLQWVLVAVPGIAFAALLTRVDRPSSAARRIAGAIMAKGNTRLLTGPRVVQFDSVGLDSRGAFDAFRISWAAVRTIGTTHEHLIIELAPGQVIAVPLGSLKDRYSVPQFLLRLRDWRSCYPPWELECPKCRYALIGATRDGCPECGWNRDYGANRAVQ